MLIINGLLVVNDSFHPSLSIKSPYGHREWYRRLLIAVPRAALRFPERNQLKDLPIPFFVARNLRFFDFTMDFHGNVP